MMGRPRSRPPGSDRKDIWFTPRQLEMLEALRETAPYGKPSFTALVAKAIDVFIDREMAKPEVRQEVAKYLSDRAKVVTLRDVSRANGNT